MKNHELAQLFEQAADVLAVQGENVFRVNAYKKIARTLDDIPQDIETLAKTPALEEIPGIGKPSAEKIREFLRSGKIGEFEEIFAEVPAGVMQMMKIPTVGPKTVAVLWKEGGISTVEDLKKRLEDGAKSLAGLPGLGEKKLQKIKENLTFLAASAGRIRLGEALPIALELVEYLQTVKGVKAAQYCGSLRRGKETIGDIDIAVSAEEKYGPAISAAVTKHQAVSQIIGAGPSKTSFRTSTGLQVDVRVVPPESFGAAIQYFTGSKEHNVHLREIAVKQGLKINEWGVYKIVGGKEERICGATEEEIYAAVGLAWMPPEMREDRGEIEWAIAHAKDKKQPAIELIELKDIRGDLHMHTTASDGTRSIEDMVAECKRRGFEYCAITDHSKSEFQANGLKVDRLLEHVQAIHAVAKEAAKSGMLVLAGSEVDILADGSLDYEDDVLDQLDWVVASPHAALTQEMDAATQRLVRAAANPHVCVLGHPTGRLIPGRKGLEPDMAKVIFAAARHGVALEVNAHTMRLDLRDVHVRMAVEAGVPICINTDAHHFDDFDQLTYGILTARRGWATAAHVLNTRPQAAFKNWLKDRRAQAGW
jgi:DNA polymerase (family X)